MTKIFAASAYVAVMSCAIATEGAFSRQPEASSSHAAVHGGRKDETRLASASDDWGSGRFAELSRTGANETTAVRAPSR
ncbi:hypothetical protein [Chenggangzhangella methanolivorans]|uniref:Lipoprotein n=1 Tax=Chenggangzhangella methanolivorans TaxID=1437009 RepID=A0A9E6UM90_9HYPH|nr:hypothetical protein [Chenggangzhangella methanolivorans]QZN98938.1 hypothetical protein K6K41_18805 [Chenggangzhangella methanolivorans]